MISRRPSVGIAAATLGRPTVLAACGGGGSVGAGFNTGTINPGGNAGPLMQATPPPGTATPSPPPGQPPLY
jgi:hypothetical protein